MTAAPLVVYAGFYLFLVFFAVCLGEYCMFLRVRADAEMNSREEGVDAIVMPDVTESLLWIFVWVTDDVGVLQNDLIMR